MSPRERFFGGFTLLELIVVITIFSVMGVMLLSFSERFQSRSVDPVLLLNDRNTLQEEMEIITQEYKRRLNSTGLKLSTFKTDFVDGRSLVVASETRLVSLIPGDKPVLMVTISVPFDLGSGTQELWSLFSE